MDNANTKTRKDAHKNLGSMIACSHCCTLHRNIDGEASGCELAYGDERDNKTPELSVDDIELFF